MDIDFNTFKEVYMEAWRGGCKGCTTYRPNEVTGSVLSVSEDSNKVSELDKKAFLSNSDTLFESSETDRTDPVTSFGRYVVQPLQPPLQASMYTSLKVLKSISTGQFIVFDIELSIHFCKSGLIARYQRQ